MSVCVCVRVCICTCTCVCGFVSDSMFVFVSVSVCERIVCGARRVLECGVGLKWGRSLKTCAVAVLQYWRSSVGMWQHEGVVGVVMVQQCGRYTRCVGVVRLRKW
jgi:hypothetical protein